MYSHSQCSEHVHCVQMNMLGHAMSRLTRARLASAAIREFCPLALILIRTSCSYCGLLTMRPRALCLRIGWFASTETACPSAGRTPCSFTGLDGKRHRPTVSILSASKNPSRSTCDTPVSKNLEASLARGFRGCRFFLRSVLSGTCDDEGAEGKKWVQVAQGAFSVLGSNRETTTKMKPSILSPCRSFFL